ncbi:unnamed protein product, partial [Rotaria sp. Silwood1]
MCGIHANILFDYIRKKRKENDEKLGRTESISLPTTPVEQISSTFNHKYHPLMPESLNNNDDDD